MKQLFNSNLPGKICAILLAASMMLGACGGGTPAVLPATPQPAEPVVSTPVPLTPTFTLLPPSETPAASTTQTSTAPPQPTQGLSTETLTATQEIDPAQITGDPVAVLGEPDWIDTFDSSANWTLYNTDCFRSEIVAGEMVMNGKTENICWLVTQPQIQNYYLEVTMDTSECPTGGEFGLYFRGPDTSSGYTYTLTCSIKHLLVARNGLAGTKTTLVDEAIDSELAWPTQENRLGVMAIGDHYRLYVNGVFLAEVEDSQFTEPGLIGLTVRGSELYIQTVYFDNLSYWEFPPSPALTATP